MGKWQSSNLKPRRYTILKIMNPELEEAKRLREELNRQIELNESMKSREAVGMAMLALFALMISIRYAIEAFK